MVDTKSFRQFLIEEFELPLTEVEEKGILFQTGTPVTFPFFRHLEKAPYLGSRFQQDIEPAGMYMVFDSLPNDDKGSKFLQGKMHFDNPLVIPFNLEPGHGYDGNSWKALLVKKYKKKGKTLSKILLNLGFDGIVTVDLKHKATSEIVKLL